MYILSSIIIAVIVNPNYWGGSEGKDIAINIWVREFDSRGLFFLISFNSSIMI